jgi:ComF family protein
MPERLVYQAYRFLWTMIDWLYPPACGGCDEKGERWCEACNRLASVIVSPVCSVCGQPQEEQGLCWRCQQARPAYTALRSWAIFGSQVRNAIHRLKYKGDLGVGEAMSRHLIACLRQDGGVVDLIVPVPLGLARLAERGYNQAALLAWPVALALGIPYRPKSLCRVRETRSQVGLKLSERQKNVQGAFGARGAWVAGKVVLVVDDVTTSGSTLNACATALKEAGASAVYGLTLARAAWEGDSPAAA